jgi:hypothetical protein
VQTFTSLYPEAEFESNDSSTVLLFTRKSGFIWLPAEPPNVKRTDLEKLSAFCAEIIQRKQFIGMARVEIATAESSGGFT